LPSRPLFNSRQVLSSWYLRALGLHITAMPACCR
jgi:hypothetical protein